MAEPNLREQLRSLSVRGLFGRFNHIIAFNQDEDLTIITAPNGHGKTVVLRIIDNLFNRNFHSFSRLTFDEIALEFHSGKSIVIFKEAPSLFADEGKSVAKQVSIKTFGFGNNHEIFHLSVTLPERELRSIERRFPIERVGPDQWYDHRLETILYTNQLLEFYGDQLPAGMIEALKLPEWVVQAVSSLRTRLVETQRLLSLDDPDKDERYPRREKRKTQSVVEKDAADLASKIQKALQTYANAAQRLDQSFPRRVIEFRDGEAGNDQDIRGALNQLSQKRQALVTVGLIGESESDPIKPTDSLEDESTRRILSIYVDDTTSKLGIFDEIYARIRLFKDIIDEHFSFKEIKIDSANGIRAVDKDSGSPIALSELSSGEQHELVLIYELIFKVDEGSLILIDEPELSLHVAWQKRFIPNIQKIQKLRGLSVVIATHSPQIINDRWDLVQELSVH